MNSVKLHRRNRFNLELWARDFAIRNEVSAVSRSSMYITTPNNDREESVNAIRAYSEFRLPIKRLIVITGTLFVCFVMFFHSI